VLGQPQTRLERAPSRLVQGDVHELPVQSVEP